MGTLHAKGIKKAVWLLIQTKMNAECVAEDALTAPGRGCQVYFPKIVVRRSHAGKVDYVERPLFPRYAFVDDAKGYAAIRNAPGVSNIAHCASSAVEAAVTEIKSREVDGIVPLDDLDGFVYGDQVKVSVGSFFGQRGVFQMRKSSERSLVLLDALGSIEMPTVDLERV